ncbi:MAG TPA: YciI family protein [Myxococcales bacterium]|nr:YciI family protein [Myxococcales bacterium]
MALYAFVALRYDVPLDRILKTVDRHRAYLRELHAQGKMVCSGPFVPRSGGAMLLRVNDPSEIGPILAKDPFHEENLVSDTIFVWDPNIGREGLDTLAPGR